MTQYTHILNKSILIGLAFCLLPTIVSAQKFGYVNSQLILAEMNEVRELNSNLEALRTQLKKQGKAMIEDYKRKEIEAIRKKEQGILSPSEEQTLLEYLQKKQEEILSFEKEMQQKLAEKEQKQLEPILNKVNKAIGDVARERGLSMIFEQGVLLYSDEKWNMTSAVKAKLGM